MGGAECFPLGSDAVCVAVRNVALQDVVHTAAATVAAGGRMRGVRDPSVFRFGPADDLPPAGGQPPPPHKHRPPAIDRLPLIEEDHPRRWRGVAVRPADFVMLSRDERVFSNHDHPHANHTQSYATTIRITQEFLQRFRAFRIGHRCNADGISDFSPVPAWVEPPPWLSTGPSRRCLAPLVMPRHGGRVCGPGHRPAGSESGGALTTAEGGSPGRGTTAFVQGVRPKRPETSGEAAYAHLPKSRIPSAL